MAIDPKSEYERRLAVRRAQLRSWGRRDLWIAILRGIAFGAGVLLLLLAFYAARASAWWSAIPFGLFVILVVLHDYVLNRRAQLAASVRFYERGLARIEDRWPGFADAQTGERFLDPSHPFAADLDLFGPGSLFELLCNARTKAGEDMLARWLTAPSDADAIRARQAAVQELREQLDFREALAMAGSRLRPVLHADRLVSWAAEPQIRFSIPTASLAVILPFLAIASALAWGFAGGAYSWLFFLAVFLEWLTIRAVRRRVKHITESAEAEHQELRVLAYVIREIETGPDLRAPRLLELKAQLETDGQPPSRQVARMARLLDLLDWQRNQFFAPIAVILLWEVHLAFALERWRARCGPSISRWLTVAAEFETLSSLAAYSYEHPADPFPQIADSAAGPCFLAREIGHPLIPASTCVRNDLSLEAKTGPALLIVSGSNMSGKSTLLRTVGVNAVLAAAGAPVRAASLTMSPLSVGACIYLVDSLQAHTSRFYAEIKRLRAISDLASGPFPVLFLLDEILHGTNSQDRLTGAQAVVRNFLHRGAIGLITTHDLALTRIAETLGPAAAVNIHFQDEVKDGQIRFDYRIHEGVVQKSNAIALMRTVGLDV